MSLSVQKELELLERLAKQDAKAFSELYNLYIKRIYVYALSIVKSPMLAEDISHDAFVKLWENATHIQTDRSVQAYLYTLTKNLALNVIRKASRETWISDEIISNALANSEDGLQFTERRETSKFIKSAVDQLPAQRRIIYDLCRNQGYSYKQAAEELGIKDTTVNSQMVKALKNIKEFMTRNGALMVLYTLHFIYF